MKQTDFNQESKDGNGSGEGGEEGGNRGCESGDASRMKCESFF